MSALGPTFLQAVKALQGSPPIVSLVQMGRPVLGQTLQVVWGHRRYAPLGGPCKYVTSTACRVVRILWKELGLSWSQGGDCLAPVEGSSMGQCLLVPPHLWGWCCLGQPGPLHAPMCFTAAPNHCGAHHCLQLWPPSSRQLRIC